MPAAQAAPNKRPPRFNLLDVEISGRITPETLNSALSKLGIPVRDVSVTKDPGSPSTDKYRYSFKLGGFGFTGPVLRNSTLETFSGPNPNTVALKIDSGEQFSHQGLKILPNTEIIAKTAKGWYYFATVGDYRASGEPYLLQVDKSGNPQEIQRTLGKTEAIRKSRGVIIKLNDDRKNGELAKTYGQNLKTNNSPFGLFGEQACNFWSGLAQFDPAAVEILTKAKFNFGLTK